MKIPFTGELTPMFQSIVGLPDGGLAEPTLEKRGAS